MTTGFRLNEAAGLHHGWLNAQGDYIHFTDTKTDEQYRAIGCVAIQHILAQPQIVGCPYVSRQMRATANSPRPMA
jgi:hypothetical protein